MRFRHPDGSTVHLAYCTNVHPAETLDGVLAQLRDHCEPVRKRLGRDRLGIGLWLARDAARALAADPAAVRSLRGELDRRGLEVVTLNGFPYQGFGAEEVKYRVYKPDWADPERLGHTTELARLLVQLLPDDITEGTISTLPLAWRTDHPAPRAAAALDALRTLGHRLDALADLTGRSVRVGLEPEPGCVVETTRDAIAPLTAVGHERIGICVDTCHLATSFEDPGPALDALTAMRRTRRQGPALRRAARREPPSARGTRSPRRLRRTPVPAPDPHRHRRRTARHRRPRPAVSGTALPDGAPWRAHFHVPLHAAPAPPLTSTLDVLTASLGRLVGGPRPLTRHLEVETYTWQALPPELRPRVRAQLTDGIAAELTLARDLLTDLGLKELP